MLHVIKYSYIEYVVSCETRLTRHVTINVTHAHALALGFARSNIIGHSFVENSAVRKAVLNGGNDTGILGLLCMCDIQCLAPPRGATA